MTVFVAHAVADGGAADSFARALERRGFFVEHEQAERIGRPLVGQDMLALLWSQAMLLEPGRFVLERRALDAWADGKLILIALDGTARPVGLRDLPAVDATLEQRRSATWEEAAAQIRERAHGAPRAAPAASPPSPAPPQRKTPWFPFRRRRAAGAAPALAAEQAQAEAGAALFVSYAHADDAHVAPVIEAVKHQGREVWMDQEDAQPGEGWAGEIVRAIRAAHAVLVMCSGQAFQSDHVKREVYLADRYKKPMLPVFLEPAVLPEDFEYFFAGVQWLELHKTPEAERAAAIARALASV